MRVVKLQGLRVQVKNEPSSRVAQERVPPT